MGSGFSRSDPVLYFAPRAHVKPGRRADREYLLWPAWAYRVVTPRLRARQLDLFQKVVMGMARAGVTVAAEAAARLHLHYELVAFIVRGLQEMGFLDLDGLPTRAGTQALAEESLDAGELSVGYVFQDPWNGELWPRMADRLDYAEVLYENDFPRLLLGTSGKPWSQSAFMVVPKLLEPPPPPSPADILYAARRHRRATRSSSRPPIGEEDEATETYAPEAMDRVAMVDAIPRPVFLATYLYLPEGTGNDWFACDPFGLGASPLLRRAIENRAEQFPPLSDVLGRLLSRSLHGTLGHYRDHLQQLTETAERIVTTNLTAAIRGSRAFDHLVGMERERQDARWLEDECPPDKLEHVLAQARKALEQAFADLAENHPQDDVWQCVYVRRDGKWFPHEDQRYVRSVYEAAAHAVGFSAMPRTLHGVRPGHIRSVCEYGDSWRLRPAVVAALLCARQRQGHPLRRAARQRPNLLQEIDEVATHSGEASHASDSALKLSDVELQVNKVYDIISCLIGLEPQTAVIAEGGVAHHV